MAHVRSFPLPVKKGEPIRSYHINQILELLRGLDITGGPGVKVTKSTSGITIAVSVPPAVAAAGTFDSIIPPFYLEQVDDSNVFVRFGQVGGITPTNVASNLDVSATASTWAIYFDLTINDAGVITAATISKVDTGIVPAHTSSHAYFLIGEVDVEEVEEVNVITAVRPSLMFTLGFMACGRDTADPATTPGTYTLFVGSSSGVTVGP